MTVGITLLAFGSLAGLPEMDLSAIAATGKHGVSRAVRGGLTIELDRIDRYNSNGFATRSMRLVRSAATDINAHRGLPPAGRSAIARSSQPYEANWVIELRSNPI